MAKADDNRVKAAELAVGAAGVSDPVSFTNMATSILAFLTGAAVAASPSSGKPAGDTNVDASNPIPEGGQGSAALDTSASGGQSNGGGTLSNQGDGAGSDPGNAGAASGADAPGAGGTDAQGDAQSDDVFDGSAEAVQKLKDKCTALAGRDGAAALLAEFAAVDAQKWSGVKPEQYPALYASITAKGI